MRSGWREGGCAPIRQKSAVILNSFSCAGLRLRIHFADQAAVRAEKWTLKQVQGDGGFCVGVSEDATAANGWGADVSGLVGRDGLGCGERSRQRPAAVTVEAQPRSIQLTRSENLAAIALQPSATVQRLFSSVL